MKEIYLIANNRSFDPKKLDQKENSMANFVGKLKNEFVCHFNKALFRDFVEPNNINYLMLALFTFGDGGYFGSNTTKQYDKHYFCCTNKNFLTLDPWLSTRNKFENVECVILSNYPYPPGKFRSVGYTAIKFFEPLFDKINLVGFNFSGDKCHNWEFEKNYALNNKQIVIIDP